MKRCQNPLRNEKGSVIVVAMIMLVLLTLIGISSTNTSSTEVQIAANNQNYNVEFYLADSGWRQAAIWLENCSSAPSWVNTANGDNTVKNFGSNTPADTNTSDLGLIVPDNYTLSQYQIPYWYRVDYLDSRFFRNISGPEGNEKGYNRFYYEITSNANTNQQVEVRASKIFKVGY